MSQTKETELCYFCEVGDKTGFDQAQAVEQHVQYEYRLPLSDEGARRGRVRVRKTTKSGEDFFTETLKTPIDPTQSLGDIEDTVAITEAYFENWKKTFLVDGQAKTRYTFIGKETKLTVDDQEVILPSLKFEVDVFLNPQGGRSQFAKVDIELQDIIAYIKDQHKDIKTVKIKIDFSSLPLKIGRVIDAATQDTEERAAISNFFKVFSLPQGR